MWRLLLNVVDWCFNVLARLSARDCRGTDTRWGCTVANLAEPALRGVLSVRFRLSCTGRGNHLDTLLQRRTGCDHDGGSCRDGTAVGSDGLGRDGWLRMTDCVWKSQDVSEIQQQPRGDSGSSLMWRLLLDVVDWCLC
jgi:hypothetical protein